MFKRKIEEQFNEWLTSLKYKKKALVVRGARQTGKTTAVLYFAKKNFKNVVYINFKIDTGAKFCFSGDLKVDEIITSLSAYFPDINFLPHETVLIFDEIQECSRARSSIKAFMLDGRYEVIATGSLLGIKGYNPNINQDVPVGFEYNLCMHSLDFEEFLWAMGVKKEITDILRNCFIKKEKIPESVHSVMLKYFNRYICVGGMPEVVAKFVDTKNMNEVLKTQRDIIQDYKDDFGKHLDKEEKTFTDSNLLLKINEVFDSIPKQLAKENKKFQYSDIKSAGRSSEYQKAIQWLKDYGIIGLCNNLSNLELPLSGNSKNDVFKIYMADTGLFVSMLEKGTMYNILNGSLGVYKGAVYENIVADAFLKNEKELYYFRKDSGLEVDFITCYKNELSLVEVKAKSGKTKSSQTILEDKVHYNVTRCIRLTSSNIGEKDSILTLPYYLTYLLKDDMDENLILEDLIIES